MNPPFPSHRPAPADRHFTSPAIERALEEIRGSMADAELAWMFGNCFPNTPDTTIFSETGADGHPDTYVITGDIAAMWLRDSTAQVWPFLALAAAAEPLRGMLEGVIRRQARSVLLDPYANAFYRDAVLGEFQNDRTEMRPGVHERKYELDSPAAFLRLSSGYWKNLGDVKPFDRVWIEAVETVFQLIRTEQQEHWKSPYRFQRGCLSGNTPGNYGHGDPGRPCGLVRSGFRPSDDVCKLPYLVPANAMMAVELDRIAELLTVLNRPDAAAEARRLSGEIRDGLEKCALVAHPRLGEIWAYEVDGYGGSYLMDDANVPSLLALPYLGFCAKDDSRYLRTRAFCLGSDNPYFGRADQVAGIGSPHTGFGSVWPMAITMQALTAVDDGEILQCLRLLKATHAGTGFMHESFDPRNPAKFSRPWFAWANTLFGELIVTLSRERRHLLEQAL